MPTVVHIEGTRHVLIHRGTTLPLSLHPGDVVNVIDDGLSIQGFGPAEVGAMLTITRPVHLVAGADGVLVATPSALSPPSSEGKRRIFWVPPKSGPELIAMAEDVFDLVSAMLPPRLANEELGDALEDVRARIARGQSLLRIYLRILTAILWTFFHAVKHGWRQGEQRKGGS